MNHIISSIRKNLDPNDQFELDRQLSVLASPGQKYQAAFQLLALRRPPALRDRIVRLAVLSAHKNHAEILSRGPLSTEALFAAESDTNAWRLPEGVSALGRIWAGLDPRQRGPIITTNFDPLVEVSLRRAGLPVSSRWMDSDGSFRLDLGLSEVCNVIHLHGYWRDSQTLSMTSQLTQHRPALAGSIRVLLANYTLVVIGYSGWQDAVMTQLGRMLDEQEHAELDVLWCSFLQPSGLSEELDVNIHMASLKRAPGNIQFYAGIDANKTLPTLEKEVAHRLVYSDSPDSSPAPASPLGWISVTTVLGDARSQREPQERALAFFEGREPTLRDGFNAHVPRRDVVDDIARDVTSHSKLGPSLTLIQGASGEGKSTALVQVASRILEWRANSDVLFSSEGGVPSPSQLLAIPSDRTVFLLIDNIDNGITELKNFVRNLNEGEASHIHMVVASRDTDWQAVGGSSYVWRNYVTYRVKTLLGISRPDAIAMVDAWSQLGSRGLGDLRYYTSRESRVSALLSAAADQDPSRDGSLFGAVLSVRYGDGLVDHVRQLVIRLRDRAIHVPGRRSPGTLLDALTYVALPHSFGVRSLSRNVLGEIFELSRPELDAFVLAPLGDETPLSLNGDRLVTRHVTIASAVVQCVGELGVEVAPYLERLVTASVRLIDRLGVDSRLMDIAYISRVIHVPELALAGARAAANANPKRLSYQGRLSSALRSSSDPAAAEKVCEVAVSGLWRSEDAASSARILINEWGVCWGALGDSRLNAYLAALAMSDIDGAAPVAFSNVDYALKCFGHALCQCWAEREIPEYALGVRAVLVLLELSPNEPPQREWMREYENVARSATASIVWVADAVSAMERAAMVAYSATSRNVVVPGVVPSVRLGSLQKLFEREERRAGAL